LSIIVFFQFTPSSFGVNTNPHNKSSKLTNENRDKEISIAPEVINRVEKKAKRAFLFTAIGVGFLVATIAILATGALGSAIPMGVLGLAALFGNIGFVKAFRISLRTKSKKRSYAKARRKAKTTLILGCVLGITLIFGLLHMLLDKGPSL